MINKKEQSFKYLFNIYRTHKHTHTHIYMMMMMMIMIMIYVLLGTNIGLCSVA